MPRHRQLAASEEEDEEEEEDVTPSTQYANGDIEMEDTSSSSDQIELLARKLVRYALSCEYSRTPIRRSEISAKVLPPGTRLFRSVFAEAQLILANLFAMQLVELPRAEKFTVQQKRAANKNDAGTAGGVGGSNAWVLCSTLPQKFRTPEIIAPARAPTVEQEAVYTGFYTLVVSLLYFAGGSMTEANLERYLRKLGADHELPIDRTEKVIARMIKDGYIVKVKDSSSGDEMVDYHVGPRGKVEVGPNGAANLARTVMGGNEEERADTETRLERTLAQFSMQEAIAATQAETRRQKGKKKVQIRAGTNAESDEEVEE